MARPSKNALQTLNYGWFGTAFVEITARENPTIRSDDYGFYGTAVLPAENEGSGGVGGEGGAQNVIRVIICM
jgi:hypothetical protein